MHTNLPFGTQESSYRLNEAYFLQARKGGHRKTLCPAAPQGPVGFSGSYLHTWKHGLYKGSPSVWPQEVET